MATFRRVVFPAIRSAVIAGTLLTFSRCLGEIGSVILVSGNRTGHTLTAPVFIFSLTSQFRFAEAAAVATFLFAISFVLVLATSALREAAGGRARERRGGHAGRRRRAGVGGR